MPIPGQPASKEKRSGGSGGDSHHHDDDDDGGGGDGKDGGEHSLSLFHRSMQNAVSS